ncbi:MAG TPA: MBL fold metallo-hydrolase [Candidatus Bathyarchaeia archaeon]|nr:MBL fold metallo-hydrolase [Candidatus Bathyarchaeia archaeon]
MVRRLSALIACISVLASMATAQANGKLQIHHIDVGQGDGAVLISPGGQVVVFDAGEDMKKHDCTRPVSYLDQLGVKHIDYLFVSHYHFDHIGCIPAVLGQFPLLNDAFDRGSKYPGATYTSYVHAVGSHRKTAAVGDTLTLDKNSQNPVVITVVAVDGKSKHGTVQTSNENDLSLAAVVSFGSFKEEIGGDLSGDNTQMYQDVETPVAPDVGQINVYKVHHHCSSHSTNDTWLADTKPMIGIISAGDGNDYGHPTADCLERLHTHNVKAYWTETGNGAAPEPGLDTVGGNIIIEVAPNASTFSVTYGGSHVDTYSIAGSNVPSPNGPVAATPKYAWSKKSSVYHLATCRFVQNIAPENLQRGDTPPPGKALHKSCPE